MLILRLFFVVILFLLNSCAGSPSKASVTAKSATPAKVSEMKEKARQKEAATAIDPDVMFMLLVAEIAGQMFHPSYDELRRHVPNFGLELSAGLCIITPSAIQPLLGEDYALEFRQKIRNPSKDQ